MKFWFCAGKHQASGFPCEKSRPDSAEHWNASISLPSLFEYLNICIFALLNICIVAFFHTYHNAPIFVEHGLTNVNLLWISLKGEIVFPLKHVCNRLNCLNSILTDQTPLYGEHRVSQDKIANIFRNGDIVRDQNFVQNIARIANAVQCHN